MIGSLQYGSVVLRLTYIDLDRKPMRSEDDTTLECMEYVFDVQVTYNPFGTTYDGIGKNLQPQVSVNGSFAGTTDIALREYLSQPRRSLQIYYGDISGANKTFLQSPDNGVPSDARGGPFCDVMSIRAVDRHGTKTWIMHLRFRTYIACKDSDSPVLSHRVRKTESTDQDYFASVITNGVAVFDVGRLWKAELSPDFWRSEFFEAPNLRFRRESINVEVSDDNRICRYTVIDREVAFSLGLNSPACRVECDVSTGYTQGSLARGIAQFSQSVMNLGGFADTGGKLLAAYNAQVPRYFVTVHTKAWGSPSSTRYDLFCICLAIATAKVGSPNYILKSNMTEVDVHQDAAGKFVEVIMTLRYTEELVVQLAEATFAFLNQLGNPLERLPRTAEHFSSAGKSFYGEFFPPNESIGVLDGGVPRGALGSFADDYIGNRPPGAGSGVNKQPAFAPNQGGPPNQPFPINLVAPPGTPRPQDNPDLYARGPIYLQKLIVNALQDQCESPEVIGFEDERVEA